jgi:hypothetical protein
MDITASIQTQYIVKVGAGPKNADPRFLEFQGRDFWGPFEKDEADTFVAQVKQAVQRLAEEDPKGFVYGEVEIEVHPLSPAVDRHRVGDAAERAARNWWLDAEGREAF